MALILALNPGNSHSPTLSRLARELHGCELIGAESCSVAINAIRERVPDVVLLPATPARGEADLMAHLKTIPGGVLTLKLPPVEKADPLELAGRIRQMLTGAPITAPAATASSIQAIEPAVVPIATSPYLIAAANATINWIRTRRAGWADEQPSAVQLEPVPQWAGASSPSADAYEPIESEDYEPYQPLEMSEPSAQYATDDVHEPHAAYGSEMKTWLPRAAAVAVIVGVAGAVMAYWPQIRGTLNSSPPQVDAPREAPEPAAIAPPSVVTAPADATSEPNPDPLENTSGWVAVFSPFDVQITDGGQAVRVDDRGRAMLRPGRHRLRFQNLELGYDETRAVDVRPTETTTVNLTPQTTVSVTSNEPAQVWIDGAHAGDTPFEGRISLGTHSVAVRTAGGERQLTVEATSKPVQLEVDFSKP